MDSEVRNLRIRFFGVQGSASTFPSREELQEYQEHRDYALLSAMLVDLERYREPDGRLSCTVERILGAPLSRESVAEYVRRLRVDQPRVYAGWTTCVLIETADGDDIVLDAGSGFRNCAKYLQVKWHDRDTRSLHLLGTHSHLDHTGGFDQAAVCYDRRNTIHIYGNRQFLVALDSNLGIFSREVPEDLRGVHTPIDYSILPAGFAAVELRNLDRAAQQPDGEVPWEVRDAARPLEFGETRITPFEVHHPAPCYGYSIERGGRKFVFCTDHELRHGEDDDDPVQRRSVEAEQRLRQHAQGADLLYRDAQFLRAEYDGLKGIGSSTAVSRQGWGHSCIEDVIEMATQCEVRRTLLGHNDPNREWAELNEIDEDLVERRRRTGEWLELARTGMVVDL